ncbi:MAG: LptE family protein [Syntrophobacterales bacterium]|nr:MAG: LptE family protein [Syntrophobacterales bacterium]
MKPIQVHFLFSIIFFLSMGTGCGYQFGGEGFGPSPDIRSIAIPTFTNETYEAGIETIVTNAILRELIKDRRLKVVGVDEADAIMEGTVTSFAISSVAYDPTGVVSEYRTSVALDVIVKGKKKGEILWNKRGLLESDVYRVSSDVLLTEAEKERAIQKIAEELAGRIRRRLFEGL